MSSPTSNLSRFHYPSSPESSPLKNEVSRNQNLNSSPLIPLHIRPFDGAEVAVGKARSATEREEGFHGAKRIKVFKQVSNLEQTIEESTVLEDSSVQDVEDIIKSVTFESFDRFRNFPAVFAIVKRIKSQSEFYYRKSEIIDLTRSFPELLIQLVSEYPERLPWVTELYTPSKNEYLFSLISSGDYPIEVIIEALIHRLDSSEASTSKRELLEFAAHLVVNFKDTWIDLPSNLSQVIATYVLSDFESGCFNDKSDQFVLQAVKLINEHQLRLDKLNLSQRQLVDLLKSNRIVQENLTYADFGNFALSDTEFEECVKECVHLKGVRLKSKAFTGASLRCLSGKPLQSIAFERCSIGDQELLGCFRDLPLRRISLIDCFLPDVFPTGSLDLDRHFGSKPLEHLELRDSAGVFQTDSLFSFLGHIEGTLSTLHLDSFKDFDLDRLGRTLTSNVKSLILNNISSATQVSFSFIRHLTRLETFVFANSGAITPTDLSLLNPNLLMLKFTHYNDREMEGFKMSEIFQNLESLSISHSFSVDDDFLKSLPSTLESLQLISCPNVSYIGRIHVRNLKLKDLDILRIRECKSEELSQVRHLSLIDLFNASEP